MTINEAKAALLYWQMRAQVSVGRSHRFAVKKIAACERLILIKSSHTRGEGQLLRYRWNELPMPPKGKIV